MKNKIVFHVTHNGRQTMTAYASSPITWLTHLLIWSAIKDIRDGHSVLAGTIVDVVWPQKEQP